MKPKHKDMPTDYTVLSTDDLKDILANPGKGQEHNAALSELVNPARRYNENDPDTTEENKGGIRPHRPSL